MPLLYLAVFPGGLLTVLSPCIRGEGPYADQDRVVAQPLDGPSG